MNRLARILRTALLGAVLSPPPSAVAQPPPALEDCRIENAAGLSTVAARCGTLVRPENPAEPDGRQIELAVAIIPALSGTGGTDALTVIAGGPGAASTEFYVDYAAAFARILRERDILLVDQRGTGRSHPLDCPMAELDLTLEWRAGALRDAARQCLESIEGDPRYYTTSIAVQDLDAARAAFGYEQLNVYGASYGTRVALHYLRRFPERTRTVVLDGVVPADMALGPDIALDAQAALDALFARCATTAACDERFPDLERGFAQLAGSVEAAPLLLSLPDPVSGEPVEMQFGRSELAVAVRLLSYSSETVSLLPLLLHEAQAEGNFAPLAAQARLATDRLSEMLSYGMHNSVVCAEDLPYFDLERIDLAALERTYLGKLQLDGLVEICEVWPRGVVDEDFKQPVVSSKPALILSGENDPVTPPRNGERAARTLERSLHLIGAGQGHGLAVRGCLPRVIAEFVDTADIARLDTECVAQLAPAPFFLSFSGPAP